MNIWIILFVIIVLAIAFFNTARQTPEERKKNRERRGMNSTWDGWYDSDSNYDSDGDDD